VVGALLALSIRLDIALTSFLVFGFSPCLSQNKKKKTNKIDVSISIILVNKLFKMFTPNDKNSFKIRLTKNINHNFQNPQEF
jgi:hypothetical protein